MNKRTIITDNTEPPKNYLWHKLSPAGLDLGIYEYRDGKWNKIETGGGGSGGQAAVHAARGSPPGLRGSDYHCGPGGEGAGEGGGQAGRLFKVCGRSEGGQRRV